MLFDTLSFERSCYQTETHIRHNETVTIMTNIQTFSQSNYIIPIIDLKLMNSLLLYANGCGKVTSSKSCRGKM